MQLPGSLVRAFTVCAFIALSSVRLPSQRPNPSPASPLHIPVPGAIDTSGQIATLHVYTNLEQVPVLVLTPGRERQKHRFAEDRFRITLDGGQPFRPVHVRAEGDDPIDLSILIDTTGPAQYWIPKLQDALASLAAYGLQTQDRISLYAIDCGLTRSAFNLQPTPDKIRSATDNVLGPWRAEQASHHATDCKPTVPLFDAVAHVSMELARLPGRRIVFVLTDGLDRGSRTHWADLKIFTQACSISVFALMPSDTDGLRLTPTGMARMLPRSLVAPHPVEDYFDLICQLSGGVELPVHHAALSKKLADALKMVRERYIIEFPRGDHDQAGEHLLNVTISRTDSYIRAAGISVPVADRKLLDNPLTIPGESGKAPEPGTRRILLPDSPQ